MSVRYTNRCCAWVVGLFCKYQLLDLEVRNIKSNNTQLLQVCKACNATP